MFTLSDIKGYVRGFGEPVSIKGFVQPFDPMVMQIASILTMSDDPIAAAQDFVHRVIQYTREEGDYWRYPVETLEDGWGDCDEFSTLLCSILRNYFPPEDVMVAVGGLNGGGHAWVLARNRIIESTVDSKAKVDTSKYRTEVLFNDRYCYAEPNEFGFILVGDRYKFQSGA